MDSGDPPGDEETTFCNAILPTKKMIVVHVSQIGVQEIFALRHCVVGVATVLVGGGSGAAVGRNHRGDVGMAHLWDQ